MQKGIFLKKYLSLKRIILMRIKFHLFFIFFIIIINLVWGDVNHRRNITKISPNDNLIVTIKPIKNKGSLITVNSKKTKQILWQANLHYKFINPFISDTGDTILLISDTQSPSAIVYDKKGHLRKTIKAESFLQVSEEYFFGSMSITYWYANTRQKPEFLEVDIILNGQSVWQKLKKANTKSSLLKTRVVKIYWQ